MGRRASREMAMKLLYQFEIQKDDREQQISDAFDESEATKKDMEYIQDVIKGVSDNVENIDKLIEEYSRGWKINRISKVDLSILRLSIYELTYRKDIPVSVSINEAVEMAKKYSGEDAGAFVNGILAKIPHIDKDEKSETDNNL